jgi:hypothetical protein
MATRACALLVRMYVMETEQDKEHAAQSSWNVALQQLNFLNPLTNSAKLMDSTKPARF